MDSATALPKALGSIRPVSQNGTRDLLVRLFHARLAGLGFVITTGFVLSALLASVIAPYNPNRQQITNALKGPSADHLLGTDQLGRDILSRVLYRGQASLEVGFLAVGMALSIGVALGLIAGYWSQGWVETAIMRAMDALLAFPALVLALAFVAALGPGLINTIIAVGIVYTPAFARLTRGQVLSAREHDYVEAARTVGAPDWRIILYHLLPNVSAPLIVQTSLYFATAILAEASLSFLGLGVQPPTPSWGEMLNAARGYLETDPWLIVGPGIAIFAAVLGFNFLGDGIRDVLDPRLH